jgi:hypothetical protein
LSDFYAQDNDDWSDVVSEVLGTPPAEEAPAADAGTTEPEAVAEPEVAPAEVVENAESQEDAEAQAVERARDEKGRFAKQEAEQELILGKFKSQDDLVESYRQLEARLGQTHAERQELNELRQMIQEQGQQFQQAVNRPRYDFDTLIEEDPARATMIAYENGDQHNVQRAAAAWNEMSPGAPQLWVQNIQLQRRIDEIDQRVQPVEQRAAQSEFGRGIREVEAEYGPLAEIIERAQTADIPDEVSQLLLHSVQNGTPEQQIGAIKALARLSTPGQPSADNLTEAARAIARETAEEADRAVAEAAVASAAQTRPEPAAPKGEADRLWEAWEQFEAPRRDGYNGF